MVVGHVAMKRVFVNPLEEGGGGVHVNRRSSAPNTVS